MPLHINPSIERLGSQTFGAKWKYGTQPSDKWNPTIGFRFHCGGEDVRNRKGTHRSYYNAPPKSECTQGALNHTEVGYDQSAPWYVLAPEKFWPYTWIQLTEVVFAIYSNVDNLVTVSWPMSPPLEPKLSLALDGTAPALVAKVDPRASDMGGDKGHHAREFTRVWVKKTYEGQPVPSIRQWQKAGGATKDFTATSEVTFASSGSGPSGTYFTTPLLAASSVAGDGSTPKATLIQVFAANEGASGESEVAYAEHVFARPNTCTCEPKRVGDQVLVAIRYGPDRWHPTDAIVLERYIGPYVDTANPDSEISWTAVATHKSERLNSGAITTLVDGGNGAFAPAKDKATWYRVRTWHDSEANQNFGYARYPALVSPPASPTISDAAMSTSGTTCVITARVTIVSEMEVDTQVRVMSGSDVVVDWSDALVKADAGDDYVDVEIPLPNTVGGKDPRTIVYQLEAKNTTKASVYNASLSSTGEGGKSGDIKSDEMAEQLGHKLSTPTIDRIEQNADGTSLTLWWSWKEDDTVPIADEQGTEVAWTSRSWDSTSVPSTHKVKDGAMMSGMVVIDDLEEGVEYNIEVKRYVTIDGKDGYSLADRAPDPSRKLYATPQSTPEKPYLRASSSVPVGSGITYRWTFVDTNNTPQTDAMLIIGDGNPEHQSELVTISGSQGSYTYQTADDDIGTLVATVSVRTGGGWSEPSNEVSTTVAEPPTCTIEAAGTTSGGIVSALPLTVTLGGTGDAYSVVVACISGSTLMRPDGRRKTAPGQVVAAIECDGGTHEIPCVLVQGARYEVRATSNDSRTGLSSETATLELAVDWASKATPPSGTVAINGGRATITAAGEASEACNIWRKTSDGPVLAYEDAAWSTEGDENPYHDAIPPYSWDGCGYIIESVTADGDATWVEVPYAFVESGIRIDWDGGSLAAPWNLDISSRYERDFKRTVHPNGKTSGHWGPCTLASASISVQSIPEDDELVVALKELARSNGICAVRATDGFLMFGDVLVDISRSYEEGCVNARVDVTGIDADDAFDLEPEGVETWESDPWEQP